MPCDDERVVGFFRFRGYAVFFLNLKTSLRACVLRCCDGRTSLYIYCVWVRACKFSYIYMYIYIYTFPAVYIYLYVHTYKYVCIYVYTLTHEHTCMCTNIHIHKHKHTVNYTTYPSKREENHRRATIYLSRSSSLSVSLHFYQ